MSPQPLLLWSSALIGRSAMEEMVALIWKGDMVHPGHIPWFVSQWAGSIRFWHAGWRKPKMIEYCLGFDTVLSSLILSFSCVWIMCWWAVLLQHMCKDVNVRACESWSSLRMKKNIKNQSKCFPTVYRNWYSWMTLLHKNIYLCRIF